MNIAFKDTIMHSKAYVTYERSQTINKTIENYFH